MNIRIRAGLLAVLLLAGLVPAAWAQSTIFIVRHAERADVGAQKHMMGDDPPLSEAGQARARRLATMLRSAGIEHVYATEFKRTQQTVAPLAEAAHVAVTLMSSKDTAGLVRRLREGTGAILVAGHSDTVPQILKALGIDQTIAIGDAEYDNLFVVVRPAGGPPVLVRIRF